MSTELVRGGSGAMFDAIAPRYDLMNRLISFGVDRRWRRRTVDALALPDDGAALDLATGTGDLALAIARRHPRARVVGVDPSTGMLELGRAKAARAGAAIGFQVGVAEELPFDDASFDAVSIAFGIRNVVDRPAALAEMARVTRPGGRIAILELGEPRAGIMAPLARFHIHQVVPRLGALLSGAREYRYLERSIARFPPADEFAALMERAGLSTIEIQPLTFGVCNLYVATPTAAVRA
jgi:demethylmenaquinone methyltransferase/2-methoxy-6-polyprenyl-1,4-benzoquinol methylase